MEIRVWIVRLTGEKNLKLGDRFIEAMCLEQIFAHIEVGNVILLGEGECSIPKPLGVVPVGSLELGAPGKNRNDDRRCDAEEFAAIRSELDNRPGRSDAEANLRQVGVAISVRLTADLDQSNHRQEHDQIPEPARDQVRPTLSENENDDGNQDQ